jgi:hypothetical protein
MAPAETPDRAAQELLRLARKRFGKLSKAETKLLRSVPRGEPALCGPSNDLDDPSNDPSKADEWGAERHVRAELIRWLCVYPEAVGRVDPIGIRLLATKITGPLDLSFAEVLLPLWLIRCRVPDEINLMSASLPALNLTGSRTGPIQGDGVTITGNLFLREGFMAEGEVRLLGAQVGGDLDCSGGRFKNPPREGAPESGTAIYADGVHVGDNLFLRRGFGGHGEVRLQGARIGGDLDCAGGTFKNPPGEDIAGSGTALNADRFDVGGSVFLSEGFTAEGEVRLPRAQIRGDLTCTGGTFKNPPREGLPESDTALNAEAVNVGADVFLHKGFTAEGEVRLLGAQVGQDLTCVAARLSELNAQGARIAHHLFLQDLREPEGETLDLTNASADALFDDEASWPGAGNLRLDGFVYGRISEGPTDAETRLRWLALQPWFTPQPYRQLAKVLREMGDDRGARRVLYEMEMLRRREQSRIWRKRIGSEKLSRLTRLAGSVRYGLVRVWGWLLKATIGYGFRLQRTLYWLAGLTLFGTLLFGLGYLGGAMTPTEHEAYACFEKQGWPPRHYQQFNPLVYSLENSVPLLRLGQDSAWAPDPGPREQEYPGAVNFAPFKWLARVAARWHFSWLAPPWFLRLFRWGQIILGWVLATLFVAGVTGVVRRE